MITPNLRRLDINTHQTIGKASTEIVGDAIGMRVDAKVLGIMLRAEPVLNFNIGKANYDERVYIFVKIDQPEAIRRISVRMVLDTSLALNKAAVTDYYAEWDIDMTGYTGGWKRIVLDPYKTKYNRKGTGTGGGVDYQPRWRWAGVMFDIADVGGRGSNVWLKQVDIGRGITIHDATGLSWSDLSGDEFGMIQRSPNGQIELLGDVVLQNVQLESVSEFLKLKDTDLIVSLGCDYAMHFGVLEAVGTSHVDFSLAESVQVTNSGFLNIVGDPFTGYSVKFADNVSHQVENSTFQACGLVQQQSTQFVNNTFIDKVPQPTVFDFAKSYRINSNVYIDGTAALAAPDLNNFTPFDTWESTDGNQYWVGAVVPFNKLFFEGDLFGGDLDTPPVWTYWNGVDWALLTVTGDQARILHGEIAWDAPPDWQVLDGLYQVCFTVGGLFSVYPDPVHKFAFYTPVIAV